MVAIKVSDPNLLTPSDYAKVRMELFEKIGAEYLLRYEAAQTFLQMAADIAIGDASEPYNTLEKLEAMITELQAPTDHDTLGNLRKALNGVEFGHVDNSTPLQIPELTTTARDAYGTTRAGMVIYNTTTGEYEKYNGTVWSVILNSIGASVASATNLAPITSADSFPVSGTTTINAIISTTWKAGRTIKLQFTGACIITHDGTVAGDNKKIILKKAANYTTVANDVLVLWYNGTSWYEINDLTKVSGGLNNVVEDETPQLGGWLDANGKSIHEAVGTTFAAANNIAPTRTGNTFVVSGSTQINLIDIAALWTSGNVIRLQFTGTPVIKHNYTVSGTNKPIFLKKAADYTAVANDVLVLLYDGTVWREIGELTKATGGAGGHMIKNNAGTALTARTNLTIKTNGTAEAAVDNSGADSTDVTQKLNTLFDVNPTGLADGDLWKYDSASAKTIPQPTTPFIDILRSSEANIAADGILSTFIPAGYKIDSIVIKNQTANAAGNVSIGTASTGTQVVNAATIGASAVVDCTLVEDFFSEVNDTDLYISSSAWGTGIVTVYFTFKRII